MSDLKPTLDAGDADDITIERAVAALANAARKGFPSVKSHLNAADAGEKLPHWQRSSVLTHRVFHRNGSMLV